VEENVVNKKRVFLVDFCGDDDLHEILEMYVRP
jgi:hypothetical protein